MSDPPGNRAPSTKRYVLVEDPPNDESAGWDPQRPMEGEARAGVEAPHKRHVLGGNQRRMLVQRVQLTRNTAHAREATNGRY